MAHIYARIGTGKYQGSAPMVGLSVLGVFTVFHTGAELCRGKPGPWPVQEFDKKNYY